MGLLDTFDVQGLILGKAATLETSEEGVWLSLPIKYLQLYAVRRVVPGDVSLKNKKANNDSYVTCPWRPTWHWEPHARHSVHPIPIDTGIESKLSWAIVCEIDFVSNYDIPSI
jgi:hypothetical protein